MICTVRVCVFACVCVRDDAVITHTHTHTRTHARTQASTLGHAQKKEGWF